MASTEQRTGFRLPWAPDARPGSDDDAQTSPSDSLAPGAEGTTTDGEQNTEAREMSETATNPDRTKIKSPDPDAGTAEATEATEAVPTPAAQAPAPPRAKPANSLVTGLVRAMRDASAAARQETADRFAAEAKARIEAIHAQSADEATELRKQADSEIVEIRDWSKAEVARIREATDQRIAERRGRLESQVEEHAARVEHRIERVRTAIGEFERQMDTFFERLLAEEDPTRLAGLAESLPEAPSLDIDDLDVDAPAAQFNVLDADGAAAAEAEALVDLGNAGMDAAETDHADAIETFAGDQVGLPEAVASKVAVVGLVSVASIAGFKRALAKTHGVRSVAVASGPTGDFIFSVVHDAGTDLGAAVVGLDGFSAAITGEAEGVLTVTASDPDTSR